MRLRFGHDVERRPRSPLAFRRAEARPRRVADSGSFCPLFLLPVPDRGAVGAPIVSVNHKGRSEQMERRDLARWRERRAGRQLPIPAPCAAAQKKPPRWFVAHFVNHNLTFARKMTILPCHLPTVPPDSKGRRFCRGLYANWSGSPVLCQAERGACDDRLTLTRPKRRRLQRFDSHLLRIRVLFCRSPIRTRFVSVLIPTGHDDAARNVGWSRLDSRWRSL